MKNKQFNQSKTKKKLDFLKGSGKKSVVWSLKPDMAEFLSGFYSVTPFLYTIRTKRFQNIRLIQNTLLKSIHYACKNGKNFLTRSLTKDELELLKSWGVSYRILKYKIILQ